MDASSLQQLANLLKPPEDKESSDEASYCVLVIIKVLVCCLCRNWM